jgi:flagellar capping protein FliD
VDLVTDFADKYNTATGFLSADSEISGRVQSLADSFRDTKYFSQSLSSIGVSVHASTGKLSGDTGRLTKALKESPDEVESALGKNGLADRAASKVDFAESQKDKLFPTVNQMMGSDAETTKALYSGRAMTAQMNYINAGNLLNMYF